MPGFITRIFKTRSDRQSGYAAARKQFTSAGLVCPTVPPDLASYIRQRGEWLYSTRELAVPPYHLADYEQAFDNQPGLDYAVLSHDGHGVNSYAVQYYLVRRGLGLFLHLAWGGVYMDNEKAAAEIARCFNVADRIVSAADIRGHEAAEAQLKIVASDFYGGYWSINGARQAEVDAMHGTPLQLLESVLPVVDRSLQET